MSGRGPQASQSCAITHTPRFSYRPDIDGLRAVAIISVVLFHTFPNILPGGFVGVDIFFVISGYLITGIILKAQSEGDFSLVDFYFRRIKRIFPALILILGFSLFLGRYVLLSEEFKVLGQHVLAGASYVSNFLLLTEAGYFDYSSELKPLLHLWSLSIEEQFYLVWPLMLIVALRSKLNPLVLILMSFVLSFGFNVMAIDKWPVLTFYSPASRAWELLIGAALAYIHLNNIQDRWKVSNDALAWCGLTLIFWALFASSAGMPIPGWWALFPTLGAAFLIAAGRQPWLGRQILASRFLVFVGLISYPLYLWHWPLLSFARIVEGQTPAILVRLGVIAASIVLAWMTYWMLERPVRIQKHWIVPLGLLGTLVLVGAIGFQVYSHSGYPNPGNPKTEWEAKNFSSQSWQKHWYMQPQCAEKFGKGSQGYCMIYDLQKPPTVMLIGDSNANHFYPGLSLAYAKNQDNLLNLGQAGCPPFFGLGVEMKEGDLNCNGATKKALMYAIETPSVKTVILSMMGVGYATGSRSVTRNKLNYIRLSRTSKPGLTEPLAILEDAMRETLQRLTTAKKQIIFIISVPMLDFDPLTCVDFRPWRITQAHLRSPCAISQKKAEALSNPYHLMVRKVSKEFPEVKVLDVAQELCDGINCWAMKGGTLLYRDPEHLSIEGSVYVGERLDLNSTNSVRHN